MEIYTRTGNVYIKGEQHGGGTGVLSAPSGGRSLVVFDGQVAEEADNYGEGKDSARVCVGTNEGGKKTKRYGRIMTGT